MKKITLEEARWLYDNKMIITAEWISPFEGWEYTLQMMGGKSGHISDFGGRDGPLCHRKSPRACFNYARRLLTKREPDVCNVTVGVGIGQ